MQLDPGMLEAFLATVMLVPELEAVPATERQAFVAAVARHMGEPVMDYVHLRITATRA